MDLSSTIVRAWSDPISWIDRVAASYDFVGIDPLSSVASALDLDFDTSNRDYVGFYDKLIAPLVARGLLVELLDNIGHSIDAKNRAKGVSAKLDRADLVFACSRSAAPEGMLIKATKVRSIRAGFKRDAVWLFDRETHRITPQAEASAGSGFRPTVIMGRVSEAVATDPGLSKRSIRQAVKGRNDTVDLALELLVAEGFIDARADGRAIRHYPLKPFSETDRALVPQTCPDRAPAQSDANVPTCPAVKGTGHGAHTQNGTRSTGERAPDVDWTEERGLEIVDRNE